MIRVNLTDVTRKGKNLKISFKWIHFSFFLKAKIEQKIAEMSLLKGMQSSSERDLRRASQLSATDLNFSAGHGHFYYSVSCSW
jgi:hypothetical protein